MENFVNTENLMNPTESIDIKKSDLVYGEINKMYGYEETIKHESTNETLSFDEIFKSKKRSRRSENTKASHYALVWVCHHGLGKYPNKRKSWNNTALNVIGVYSSYEKAKSRRHEIIEEHQHIRGKTGGQGDMLVGDGGWENEIDLVIKQTELYDE